MDLELTEKVVVVTGGSDGLGRALSAGLIREGARVAICAREPVRLAAAAEALRADGGDVLDVVADVTEPDDLSRLVDLTMDRWGRIDGLVNNAGRSAAMAVADSLDADWDEDLHLKLYAAIRLARFALPHLGVNGGAIVTVLALGAKTPGASSSPSSVSRAAGMALTKTLSKEFGSEGVRVNAVLIGLVESAQWDRVAEAQGIPVAQLYENLAAGNAIPLGRVGRAREFADLVAYLLSSRASYVSGVAVNLDGGLSPVA